MWVVENTVGHHPLGGGVEKEETLLGACIGVCGGGGGNLFYDILDLVHDVVDRAGTK